MVDITTRETSNWSLINDRGNTYLSREDIFQRIRFSKDLNIDIPHKNSEIISSEFRGITTLEMEDKVLLVNNPKNLNPCIVKPRNDNSEVDMMVLTIGGRFKLMEYKVRDKVSIRCTFRNENTVGAVLVFDPKIDGEIIKLVLSRGKYIYDATYNYVRGKLRYTMKRRNTVLSEPNLRSRTFRYHMDIPSTEVYVTTSAHEEYIHDYINTHKLNKRRVVIIDEEITSKEAKAKLMKLTEEGYKAITQYGVKIPFDILKELRLQYVFVLSKTNVIKTIKSNWLTLIYYMRVMR